MKFETLVRDAETSERECARFDTEILDARADAERAWLDHGGIDEMAAFFGEADTSDDLPLLRCL